MSIQSIVENELIQDDSLVWMLRDQKQINYEDGAERYLERVLQTAKDLSSSSTELRNYIRDWPTEYHLTPKRAQLLSGFAFDRALRVLEVGAGCGAITRFLGETFDDVVSVEGSLSRARVAKLRTRDLSSVSVICGPFQKIRFTSKFDIIFCIGVYEYSASFVGDANPYEEVLRYFHDMLTPDGKVVIAIENQFGLKYFNSFFEDHLGVPYEGIEGYHAHGGKVRTFGKAELENNLRKYFPATQFFYPYPDYKLPDCVVAEEFLLSGHAGELVSQMQSRNYAAEVTPLWSEPLALLELSRNRALPFFSNSFLIVAGKAPSSRIAFGQLAIAYSSDRERHFQTETRMMRRADGVITAVKRKRYPSRATKSDSLSLIEVDSEWTDSLSLQTITHARCKSKSLALDAIFQPCREWITFLRARAVDRREPLSLVGEYIDCIWSNVYPGSGGLRFIDREWVWKDSVQVNVLVIRAIYNFLTRIDGARGLSDELSVRSGRKLIRKIAASIGVELCAQDFENFIATEARFQEASSGLKIGHHMIYLRWFLFDRPSLRFVRRSKKRIAQALTAIRSRLFAY